MCVLLLNYSGESSVSGDFNVDEWLVFVFL